MRRLGVWGTGAALLTAFVAAASLAGDKDDRPAPGRYGSKSVFSELFGEDKKPAPKSASKDGDKDKAKTRETAKSRDRDKEKAKDGDEAPPPRSAAATIREREEAKLLRRLEVCDRLQKIARETNDADLEKSAQQLDKRAWEIYRDRTATLLGATAALETDEDRLDKKLAAESDSRTKLTEVKDKGSKERARTAAVREVNP